MHAVSVGEVMAALPILRKVRERDPDLEIVLSVTTSSGHRTAQEKAAGLFDHLVYFPIDVYRCVLSGLVKVRPSVVAIMETELWMNFCDASQNLSAKVLLVNGRISDRSFPKSLKLRFFYKDLLSRFNSCLMQSETDRERILALGAKSTEVLGNSKYDEAVEGLSANAEVWRETLGVDPKLPVVVVGSTRSEIEEKLILDGLTSIGSQIIWAPRHIERTEDIIKQLESRGISAKKRSLSGNLNDCRVLILDTYGELSHVYSVADLVIIGGGFDHLGGQNILQPLALGKPVIHGPHMENFKDIADESLRVGASVVAHNSVELKEVVESLLANIAKREEMGIAAHQMVKSHTGASERYAKAIIEASLL